MSKPLIAVPIGDPAGVGPEIVAKSVAAKDVFDAANCIVVGDKTIMENAKSAAFLLPFIVSRNLRTAISAKES